MLSLPATLTRYEARETLQALLSGIAASHSDPVTVDASALKALDSSALAVLLDCRRQAHAAGKRLDVVGAPVKLVELARLYDLDLLVGFSTAAPAASAPTPSAQEVG
jgi:phospholipid transport system transporter-binding protein